MYRHVYPQRALAYARNPSGKVQLGPNASDNYKARLTKGLLSVGLNEGYIVEVLNYRASRILRRELFETPEEAKEELGQIKHDIETMSTIDFRKKYLNKQ